MSAYGFGVQINIYLILQQGASVVKGRDDELTCQRSGDGCPKGDW